MSDKRGYVVSRNLKTHCDECAGAFDILDPRTAAK